MLVLVSFVTGSQCTVYNHVDITRMFFLWL